MLRNEEWGYLANLRVGQVAGMGGRINDTGKRQCGYGIFKKFEIIQTSKRQMLASLITRIVAGEYRISLKRLFAGGRGNKKESLARHITVYLLHTLLSLSYKEISFVFGKDRTSISYACRIIEDLRDDPRFEERMIAFEDVIISVIEHPRYGLPNRGGIK